MRERSRQFLLMAFRQFLRSARHTALLELIREVVAAVREDEDFHLSDVLSILADYVQDESSLDPDTEQTRTAVAALLRQAAQAAEEPGRELP